MNFTWGNRMKRRHLLKLGLGTGAAIGIASLGRASTICGKTPAQIEGPFYPINPQSDKDWDLTQVQGKIRQAQGEEIIVTGQVSDEACQPIKDTVVEIWQACQSGKYNHPNDPNTAPLDPDFQYWGKAQTDDQGIYIFKTIIPGAYPADTNWIRPPHIHFKVHKWGYKELTTQLYFEGNQYNQNDRILNQIPREEQPKVVRPILNRVFKLPGENEMIRKYIEFDIVLKKII